MSSVPTLAAEPNRLRLNLAPSSSAQSTRATVIGGVPSAAMARSNSNPAITPSAPSSHPPFGTLSRWLPTTNVSRPLAAQNRPQVSGFVLVDLDRQRRQRFTQHRPCCEPLGCPRQTATALGPPGVIGQGAEVGDDPFVIVGAHDQEITG